MVAATALIQDTASFARDLVAYIPPGLFLSATSAFIEDRKYVSAFRHEFLGTLLMIGFTFSAGKWIGSTSVRMAWTSHALGVVAADYFGGGPHVNPAVTVSVRRVHRVRSRARSCIAPSS